jgi:hypothetical protein
MRRPLAVAVVLAAAACVRDPDPFEYTEPAVSLHGMLRAGETGVYLVLFRSATSGELEDLHAQVTVSGGGATVPLTRVSGQPSACFPPEFVPINDPYPGCYAGTLPQPAAPGSRWTLAADPAEGPAVTGSTTIPALPVIPTPAAGARVPVPESADPALFDVQWQTPGAARVEIRMGQGVAFDDGARVEGSTCLVAHREVQAIVGQPSGTRRMYLDDVFCYQGQGVPLEWDSAAVPLLVTAFDSAYADFALHGEGVTTGHRGASLQGAYGVFGSSATTRREIILVPQQ